MCTFGGSHRTLRCHFVGIGGTPRGRFGGIGWTPIRLWGILSRLAQNPIPSSTSQRKPEFWSIPIRVYQKNTCLIQSSWVDNLKTPRLTRFDTEQIWILFWWKRQRRRSYLQWSQSASWLQPTVWLPERICVSQRGHNESPSPSARPGNH